MVFGESYALSQRPSFFAAAISLSPAGVMRFFLIRRATFSRLRFDHMLLVRRGVNRCFHDASSMPFDGPSIKRRQSASSNVCAYEMLFWPEFFLKKMIHMPGGFVGFFSSPARQATGEANALMGASFIFPHRASIANCIKAIQL